MDLGLQARSRSSPAGAAGLGLARGPGVDCRRRARGGVRARGRGAEAAPRTTLQESAASGARVAYAVGGCLDRSRRDRRSSMPRSREFGGIDVLVNNVGTARGARTSKRPPTPSGRKRSIRRCFRRSACRALAVPHIRKQGGGAIVIVSSIFGRESGGRMTYNAVKAAEISLTKSLAQQLAKDQIRVVSVAPGIDPVRRRLVVEAPAGGSAKASRSS